MEFVNVECPKCLIYKHQFLKINVRNTFVAKYTNVCVYIHTQTYMSFSQLILLAHS
jgi:hypothetical protein